MVEQIAPELVERIAACLDIVASMKPGARLEDFWKAVDEAKAIVADLPKPVDPDLIEARKIVNRHARTANGEWANNFLSGDADSTYPVQAALAAIKLGRSLARTDQEPAHG